MRATSQKFLAHEEPGQSVARMQRSAIRDQASLMPRHSPDAARCAFIRATPGCARYARACVLDVRHVTHYVCPVIKTFADRATRELFLTGSTRRCPPDIGKRAARKLEYVNLATCLADLKVPPGNRLHALAGSRKGQYSISVNDQWRICFRLVDGDAFDVQFCDYH